MNVHASRIGIEASPSRAAYFLDTAKTIVKFTRIGKKDLVQEIAKTLETAFQNGATAAAALREREPGPGEFTAWEELPAVGRTLWFVMGIHQFGTLRNPKRHTVVLSNGKTPWGRPCWRMYYGVEGHKGMTVTAGYFGRDEVNALLQARLVEQISLKAGQLVVMTRLGESSYKKLSWYREPDQPILVLG